MQKSSHIYLFVLLLLVVVSSWFGSLTQFKTEHYVETTENATQETASVIEQVNTIPLWRGTKEERALSSQV